MFSRSLGHRAPLLWLMLPYIAGLATGKLTGWHSPLPPLAGALVLAAAALAATRRPLWIWGTATIGSLFLAGAGSYGFHRARILDWERLPPREATLTVRVVRVFSQREPRRASGLATIERTPPHLRDLLGQRIYFSLNLRGQERRPLRSAVLGVKGLLATVPLDPPADSFDSYLAGAGVNFRLTRAQVTGVEAPPNAYYQFCDSIAALFHRTLGHGIATKRPALAGLLRAMMLGSTETLDGEQKQLFMQSGTMHLFAISGLNIGVIATALQTLLLLIRLPRWARFLIGTLLLWLFVDVTGASPSAVRAFAMAVFLQAALVLRRPANPLAALLVSAFCVLLVAPLQLFSASFLMSYTIVTALLVLGLPLADRWMAAWAPWRNLPEAAWQPWQRAVHAGWRWGAGAVAVGVATTLVSLLTSVQFFHLLTPGSLLTNLVLIPAAVLVTLGGFASLVCGLFGFAAGAFLFNHAAALVLWLIEEIVRVGVRMPLAFLPANFDPAWAGNIALTALLCSLLFGYAVRWRASCGGWWPPFAIVAAVLVFGMRFDSADSIQPPANHANARQSGPV